MGVEGVPRGHFGGLKGSQGVILEVPRGPKGSFLSCLVLSLSCLVLSCLVLSWLSCPRGDFLRGPEGSQEGPKCGFDDSIEDLRDPRGWF